MHRGRLLWAVLAALVAWGGWNQRQVNRLEREVDELRASAQDAGTDSSPIAAANDPDPGLERIASELSALRGDVAALRKRLEERLPSSERGVVSAAQTAEAERRSVGSVGKSVPGYLRSGFVDRSGLPEAVLEGFRQQLGEVPIEGAHFKQSEGRLYYSMESKSAEGQHVELSLDQTGALVRMHRELEWGALPETLQGTVLQAVGDVPVRRVAEVLEDGQTGYRVQAKGANQAVELMLNQAGQVIRSETTVREKKP
jgi:hypothetical protein